MSLTQQMSPDGRRGGPRGRAGLFLLAVLVLVAVIAVTVLVTRALSGSDGDGGGATANPMPSPTSAPTRFGIPSPQPNATATSPGGPLALPRAGRIAPNGVPLGFPHTTDGAVSAAIRWEPLLVPVEERRQIDIVRTVGTQSLQDQLIPELQANYASQPPRAGSWFTSTPLGYKIVNSDVDRVTVALLVLREGGTSAGPAFSKFDKTADVLAWVDGDWRWDDGIDAPGALGLPSTSDPARIKAAGWEVFTVG